MTRVVGVDGCKVGWCAVSLEGAGRAWRAAPPVIYSSFREVLESRADLICIDIPIGLLDEPGQRACDIEARKRLGKPRGSSVFPPPCRSALQLTEDYAAASLRNFEVSGKKLQRQAFAITPKIAEVDSAMTPRLQERVKEVHPEVCFCALNGGEPMANKKSLVAGRDERWPILQKVFPSLPDVWPRPRDLPTDCAVDDYIDALAAAWTAVCIVDHSAKSIPHEPATDDTGLRMEMWLPTA